MHVKGWQIKANITFFQTYCFIYYSILCEGLVILDSDSMWLEHCFSVLRFCFKVSLLYKITVYLPRVLPSELKTEAYLNYWIHRINVTLQFLMFVSQDNFTLVN